MICVQYIFIRELFILKLNFPYKYYNTYTAWCCNLVSAYLLNWESYIARLVFASWLRAKYISDSKISVSNLCIQWPCITGRRKIDEQYTCQYTSRLPIKHMSLEMAWTMDAIWTVTKIKTVPIWCTAINDFLRAKHPDGFVMQKISL